MADKSPRKPAGKKAGKTLKEKRAAKKLKHDRGSTLSETLLQHRR
jgi:hypothetical protein